MTALLTLIIFGGLGQDVVGMPCDDECSAVLAAALQWTVEKAGEDHSVDPARLYVDVSSIKNREGQEEERRNHALNMTGRLALSAMSPLVTHASATLSDRAYTIPVTDTVAPTSRTPPLPSPTAPTSPRWPNPPGSRASG